MNGVSLSSYFLALEYLQVKLDAQVFLLSSSSFLLKCAQEWLDRP